MGLIDALRVGLSGLNTAQNGLETAQNNVANVNTPGYARQRASIEDVVLGRDINGSKFGGARVTGIDGVRNRLLDGRVSSAESGLAAAESSVGYLQTLEASLAQDGVAKIGDSLTTLFASFDQLAVRPEDPALREAVVESTRTLADQVRSTANSVSVLQADAQREIGRRAERVNQLATQIADTNREMGMVGANNPAREALLTRRTNLVSELSREIEVHSYPDGNNGLTVAVGDGTPLVTGSRSHALTVDPAPGGGLSLAGNDVTDQIGGGAIGGIIAARDAAITPTLAQLDVFATAIATEVNAQHNLGLDQTGAAGGDVFAVAAPGQPGAVARSIQAILGSGSEVAAGATNAPGDGDNARLMSDLGTKQGTVSFGGSPTTFSGAAATLIFRAGTDVRSAEDEAQTSASLRAQAVNAREALSGVSLDEEAADMIRFQRAFEASSRFLSTVDDLIANLINDLG